MKITADANVLLRAVLPDAARQQAVAVETLKRAEVVAISVHSLCEFVWVMERHYGAARTVIAASIRGFLNTTNVFVDRPAVEAGLKVLDVGGDFADGVIAYDGSWLGGERFVSFDKKAVRLLSAQGLSAELLQ